MGKYIGIQTGIRTNTMRSLYLILLLPAIVIGIIIIGLYWANGNNIDAALQDAISLLFIAIPIIIIRGVISFLNYESMIFNFTGAKPINRKDNPEIYNIIENLCIQNGLPTVKLGVINDMSCNAFAMGWNRDNSRIVFSRGILEKLEIKEIEAVAGHELTHIMNKDSLLMILIVIYIGIITTIGEIILRFGLRGNNFKEKDNRAALAILLIGIMFLVVGYAAFPLIRLAISRKREYLADAGSVRLTMDKDAMISALLKISQDSEIESIQKSTVAAMCIENPFAKEGGGFSQRIGGLMSTHPSIEDRIDALNSY